MIEDQHVYTFILRHFVMKNSVFFTFSYYSFNTNFSITCAIIDYDKLIISSYLSTFRGYARTYIKDLEKIRPSAIIGEC